MKARMYTELEFKFLQEWVEISRLELLDNLVLINL